MSFVGIVLVSHSLELVTGLKKLLVQIQPSVPIAVAGGDEEDGLGTSAQKIKEAIESVYSDKGVVVLFDLGSSLMQTEIALEWMENSENVKIANAPLVEGAYTAVVQSGCGSSLEKVLRAAEEARQMNKTIS
ncbi:dihydroxyacetone kinase phosphoryl donor subunit DhaM [Thermoflavimicrobium dichotomicum]|uniref:phosphoenolpyruvate--glycerone phosphotransferase n=1 Tax=Thermoflavimicrobium dichotomicum TaxID=46223 RepID=A0A1I3P1W4_9BACL|nr:dihydroxyacetone kinase phosphoryl donor subunit DhaM [Thermoflavimicrobium dichotomicum]SFJ15543.1 dihydroxyacetone kinase, phosphotransfer subunit [Thermoflavimicrobium dichotomicum]